MEKIVFKTRYTNPPKCDCEHYEPGTSLTVPDQVEPLQMTVNRCLRGELIKVKDTYYENDDVVSEDAAFDTLDPTSSPGFDLADTSSLLSQATQVAQVDEVNAEPSSEGDGQTAEASKTQSDEATA